MFNETICVNAIAVASAAANGGYALNPLANTFLDTLVTLAKNHRSISAMSIGEEGVLGAPEVRVTDSPAEMFNGMIDDLSQSGAAVITRNLNLARTDAVPLIARLVRDFGEVVDPTIPYAYSMLSVDQLLYPAIFQSDYVSSIASKHRMANPNEKVPEGLILSKDEPQFKDYAKLTSTGLATVDKQLAEVLAGFTDPELDALFDEVFVQGVVPRKWPGATSVGIISRILIAHVWAINLKNPDAFPSQSRYDKASYENGLLTIQSVTGKALEQVITSRESDLRNERLVLDVTGSKVVVNGDLYDGWLNSGGKPEVLLGASIDSNAAMLSSAAQLLGEAGKHIASWNTYVAQTEEKRKGDLRGTARREIFRLVKEIVEERFTAGVLVDKSDCLHRLESFAMGFENHHLKNPYFILRDLVLAIFYPDSDVGIIVRKMDEFCDDDDKLSADDAATLATIAYVSAWAAKFVELSKVAKV